MSTLSLDILLGMSVADAIGVPIEFRSPQDIDLNVVRSNYAEEKHRLTGFGTWNKPVGTFSDDSSLALCTAEYLANGETDLNLLMVRFYKWLNEGYWTSDGHTFDVGRTTLLAIQQFAKTKDWKASGLSTERDNGNGSLMRISPLLLPIVTDSIDEKDVYKYISDFSSLTHAHKLSIDACYIYLIYAKHLYFEKNALKAYENLKNDLSSQFNDIKHPLHRLFTGDFLSLDPLIFNRGGFVVGSLEIALHALLTTDNYENAVVKSMVVGGDTDTHGVIVGVLAGILYGYKSIPSHWSKTLKRKIDIENLALKLQEKYTSK